MEDTNSSLASLVEAGRIDLTALQHSLQWLPSEIKAHKEIFEQDNFEINEDVASKLSAIHAFLCSFSSVVQETLFGFEDESWDEAQKEQHLALVKNKCLSFVREVFSYDQEQLEWLMRKAYPTTYKEEMARFTDV